MLIELVGQRRIDATSALVKALENSDAGVRSAALTALGATVGAKDLSVLIAQVVSRPRIRTIANDGSKGAARGGVRMPDREACAAELAAALSSTPSSTKSILLEILAQSVARRLWQTIGAAAKSNDPKLQDIGSRLLGEWMTIDAAPVLLDLAKNRPTTSTRAVRCAATSALPDNSPSRTSERDEMCKNAFDASGRAAEQQLVLTCCKSPEPLGLEVAVKATEMPALKDDATRVALSHRAKARR